MLDIKIIRTNPELVKDIIQKRTWCKKTWFNSKNRFLQRIKK